MLWIFFVIFFSIFLAQMGDKTQLLTLLFATKIKNHILLFLGVTIAILISVCIAIFLGEAVSSLISQKIIKTFSALIFIILGIVLLIKSRHINKKYKKLKSHHKMLSIITVLVLADFGDKTQLLLALFTASYHPLLVFTAGICALGTAAFLTIFFSRIISHRLKESTVEKFAGVVFLIMGALLFT